jgi:hypothetical protein
MTRFQYDFSLLSVLLDHWRPETHTFHFTIGEMTETLQDTSLLMGQTWDVSARGASSQRSCAYACTRTRRARTGTTRTRTYTSAGSFLVPRPCSSSGIDHYSIILDCIN